MKMLWQDFRYGVRMLRRNPGFALVAVLTLSLGIGAGSAVFTVVNSILLRPLPYHDADRLVAVFESRPQQNRFRDPTAPAYFLAWKEGSDSLEHLTAARPWTPVLTNWDRPDRLNGLKASASLFELLKARPLLGRTFSPEPGTGGEDTVVVLGYDLWQRTFGGDRTILDQIVQLDGKGYKVLGVMPPGFQFPPFWATEAEFWVPLSFDDPASLSRYLRVFARLGPGVTLEQSRAEMETLTASLAAQYSETESDLGVTVEPMQEPVVAGARPALVAFLAAGGFVLLIACSNVANLLLIQGSTREKEMSVRQALGATRGQLTRLLLVESTVLAMAGGVLGLILASWSLEALRWLAPASLPRLAEIGLDGTTLAFTSGLSVLAGLVFGLAPALLAGRSNLPASLRGTSRSTRGSARKRLRTFLAVLETSVACVVLVGAGLLVNSFLRLQTLNPGFNPQGILTMNISLQASPLADRQAFFAEELARNLETLPGVEKAGLINHLHFGGDLWSMGVTGEVPVLPPEERVRSSFRTVSHGFFSTMQIPLLRGRTFNGEDAAEAPPVVVVNQILAETLWPGRDPVGRRVAPSGSGPWATVVGVVGDVRQRDLSEDLRPEIYYPYGQNPVEFWKEATLVVRSEGNPLELASLVQEEIWRADPNLPVTKVQLMEQTLAATLAGDRFNASLLGAFSAVAMLLAAVGLYGVVSSMVVQRTREIGIRMAVGGQPRHILRMVLREGGLLSLLGLALGLVASISLARFLESLLFGVTGTDLPTYLAVSALLLAVTAFACYLPARRAASLDPMVVLREE